MPVLQWVTLVRWLEGEPTYGDTQGGTTQLAGNHTPAPYLNPTEPPNLAPGGVLPLKGWLPTLSAGKAEQIKGERKKAGVFQIFYVEKKMPTSLKHSLQLQPLS